MDPARIDKIVSRAVHDDPDLVGTPTQQVKTKRKYTKRTPTIKVEGGDREYTVVLKIKIIPSLEAQ